MLLCPLSAVAKRRKGVTGLFVQRLRLGDGLLAINQPLAPRARHAPTGECMASSLHPSRIGSGRHPGAADPDPIVAAPAPVPSHIEMSWRRCDHDFFGQRRWHRANRNLYIVAAIPPPCTFSPNVMAWHPVVARCWWRRSHLDDRRRRLPIDHPGRRCGLTHNSRAAPQ